MKKYALIISIVGLAILAFAAGFMLYGVNNNQSLFWTGNLIFWIGFMVIALGLIMIGLREKDKR